MDPIMVGLGSAGTANTVVRALTAAGYQTTSLDLSGQLAEQVIAHNPAVVILDYLLEDARSVKVMQAVQNRAPFIKFILLVPEDAPRSHLILALNEGAVALLSEPVNAETLFHYVARALTRRQEEIARNTEYERCQKMAERERSCSVEQEAEVVRHKRLLHQYARLINHLLVLGPRYPRPRVLLVSDSSYQVELFRKQLAEVGFVVFTASDGVKGLETTRTQQPQIIISDLEMPGLDGLELCRAVKADESIGPNHFIISTANQNRIPEILHPDNKVDDCLIKPGRPEEFIEFMARVALGMLVG